MNRKELIEQIENLQAENHHLYEKAMFSGAFLSDEPFIPEYIGFAMQEIRDKDDILVCRVYTKDGFSISRYIDTDKKEWIIVKPGGRQPIEIMINSMEMGIKILQACGMDISVETYLLNQPKIEIPESI
jgi:chloramphenicol 3-O-phosphotransferase